MTINQAMYYDCGICGHFHRTTFDGDCREDAERFTADQLDAKHGENHWDFIEMEAVDEWRNMQSELPNT